MESIKSGHLLRCWWREKSSLVTSQVCGDWRGVCRGWCQETSLRDATAIAHCPRMPTTESSAIGHAFCRRNQNNAESKERDREKESSDAHTRTSPSQHASPLSQSCGTVVGWSRRECVQHCATIRASLGFWSCSLKECCMVLATFCSQVTKNWGLCSASQKQRGHEGPGRVAKYAMSSRAR